MVGGAASTEVSRTVVAGSVGGDPNGSDEVVGDSAGEESRGGDAPVDSGVESPQAAIRSKTAIAAPADACRNMKGWTSLDADRFRDIETNRAAGALLAASC